MRDQPAAKHKAPSRKIMDAMSNPPAGEPVIRKDMSFWGQYGNVVVGGIIMLALSSVWNRVGTVMDMGKQMSAFQAEFVAFKSEIKSDLKLEIQTLFTGQTVLGAKIDEIRQKQEANQVEMQRVVADLRSSYDKFWGEFNNDRVTNAKEFEHLKTVIGDKPR